MLCVHVACAGDGGGAGGTVEGTSPSFLPSPLCATRIHPPHAYPLLCCAVCCADKGAAPAPGHPALLLVHGRVCRGAWWKGGSSIRGLRGLGRHGGECGQWLTRKHTRTVWGDRAGPRGQPWRLVTCPRACARTRTPDPGLPQPCGATSGAHSRPRGGRWRTRCARARGGCPKSMVSSDRQWRPFAVLSGCCHCGARAVVWVC